MFLRNGIAFFHVIISKFIALKTIKQLFYFDLRNKANKDTVEPRSTSASLYEKFALRAAIRKDFCLIRQIKIHSTSDRRPSTSRGLEIRF